MKLPMERSPPGLQLIVPPTVALLLVVRLAALTAPVTLMLFAVAVLMAVVPPIVVVMPLVPIRIADVWYVPIETIPSRELVELLTPPKIVTGPP